MVKNSETFFGEEKYISSKQAAELVGYTSDYIGQLCRVEKIKARRIGRDWFVEETSILKHKNNLAKIIIKSPESVYDFDITRDTESRKSRLGDFAKFFKVLSPIAISALVFGIVFYYNPTLPRRSFSKDLEPIFKIRTSLSSSLTTFGEEAELLLQKIFFGTKTLVQDFLKKKPIVKKEEPGKQIVVEYTPSTEYFSPDVEIQKKDLTSSTIKNQQSNTNDDIIRSILSRLSFVESQDFAQNIKEDLQTLIEATFANTNLIDAIEKRIPAISQNPVVFLTSSAPSPQRNDPPQQVSGVTAGFGNFSQGIGTAGDLTATGHIKLGEEAKEVAITSKTWKVTAEGALSGITSFITNATTTINGAFTVSNSATSSFGGGISSGGFSTSKGFTITGGNILSTSGASSTFDNGFNITTGCFSINGTCVGSSSGTINSGTTNRLSYYTAATTLDSSGFLAVNNTAAFFGIATTTPGQKLSIAGNAYFDSTILSFGSSTQRLGLDLQFMNVATSTLATSTLNAFSFATSTTATPIFTIDTTSGRPSRVGIGTTSPWADFSIEHTGIGENVFAVSDFGTSSPSLVIKGSGNVGIGITAPGKLLHVGAGTDVPIAGEAGIYVTNAGTTALEVRDSTNDVSLNLYADSVGAIVGAGTNHSLFLRTNNTDKMIILSDGKVGIGTIGPKQALHVTGSGIFSTDLDIVGGDLNIGTGSATSTLTSASGFLGIGSTTPLSLLAIGGQSVSGGGVYINGGGIGIGTTTPGGGFAIATTSVGVNTVALIQNLGTGLSFVVEDEANDTTKFVVDASGNVGIGTANPTTLFEVNGTSSTTIQYIGPGSVTAPSLAFGNDTNTGVYRVGADILGFTIAGVNAVTIDSDGVTIVDPLFTAGGSASAPVFSFTGDGNTGIFRGGADILGFTTSGVERLRIGSSGLVGIGTTTPGSLLSVQGGNLQVTGTTTTSALVATSTLMVGNTGQNLIVNAAGDVGFGTTSPGTLFSIQNVANFLAAAPTATSTIYSNLMLPSLHATSSNVVFSGLSTDTGAVTASLCLTVNSVVTRNTDNETCVASSLRYKKNIETLSSGSAISILSQLRPVTFEYKDVAGLRYGFIAEEIDEIDKMLVSYDEDGLPHSVRYVSLIPLLTQAIQELNEKIDSKNWSIGDDGKLIVKEIETDKIKIKNPYGITIFDVDTGEPVCVVAKGGALLSVAGECGTDTTPLVVSDIEPPIIEIIGANPAELTVGDIYSDNGIIVTDNVDSNLGFAVFINDIELASGSQIELDTSTSTTYNIKYVAVDNSGNTTSVIREVIINNADF